MQQSFFRLYTFVAHRLKSMKSRKGYGIHSPFAFHFITQIIYPEKATYFYCFEIIEQLRYRLKHNPQIIVDDKGQKRTIKKIATTSLTSRYDGQLLFRTAHVMHSKTLVELGTSLGLGTAYIACANKKAKVISIDHNSTVQTLAKKNTDELKIKNIKYINGTFENTLGPVLEKIERLDFIFFDGHHQGDATLHYFDIAKAKSHAKSVFVFHDIHWSTDMHQAWQKIIKDTSVSLSIESYNMGFVFFDPELNKQHFLA